MSRLKLSGVSKRYGDFLAVDGIDIELKSGEFVSLLGPSGCGKTTTLRMIAGFVDPTLGTIEMDDQILSSPAGSVPPDRRQMSMIFQSYAIWPNMTVEQNVAFGLELRKLAKAEVKRRVGEIVEWSGVYSSSPIPTNFRSASESANRQAIPRSLSIPSKYQISNDRK